MSISMTEAAKILGVSRQRVHQMIKRGDFESVETFGPMLMLQRAEVEKAKAHREAVVAEMEKSGVTMIEAQRVVGVRETRAGQKANREASRKKAGQVFFSPQVRTSSGTPAADSGDADSVPRTSGADGKEAE